MIAANGVQAVTHRAVAAKANVSISNTTYHFSSKRDLVQQAYRSIIDGNADFLDKSYCELVRSGPVSSEVLAEFLAVVATIQTTGSRPPMIAWLEIMLEAARQKPMRKLAEQWYADSKAFWKRTLACANASDSDRTASILLTYLVGKYLFLIAQGAPMAQKIHLRFSLAALASLLSGESLRASPLAALKEMPRAPNAHDGIVGGANHKKPMRTRGKQTREKIIKSAAEIVARGGTQTLRLRDVGEKAGVSLAATSYHFESREDLILQVYKRIHMTESDRYRVAVKKFNLRMGTKDDVIRFTCDYALQEIGPNRDSALAYREFLLESARDPALQRLTGELLAERYHLWIKILKRLNCTDPYVGADILVGYLAGRVLVMLGIGGATADPEVCERDIRFVVDLLV